MQPRFLVRVTARAACALTPLASQQQLLACQILPLLKVYNTLLLTVNGCEPPGIDEALEINKKSPVVPWETTPMSDLIVH